MSGYVLDIETDGLLRPGPDRELMTRVHCIVLQPLDGRALRAFHDSDFQPRAGSLRDACGLIEESDLLVGHSIQSFDLPALSRFMKLREPRGKVFDTLVAARLMYPGIGDSDWQRLNRGFPRKLKGSHSLEAWGWRLGIHKGEYAKHADWGTFSQEMLDYCIQDTRVTLELYGKLASQKWPQESLALEHSFAAAIETMMANGVCFDMEAAEKMCADLTAQRHAITGRLEAALGDRVIEWETPKKKLQRRKVVPVEVSSRYQVAEALIKKYGWKPQVYTNDGHPKLDESVIADMDPEQVPLKADLLAYYTLLKRLGQLAEGKQAWIKLAVPVGDHHRIYGYVNHNGAHTGRCTHNAPNLAQTPRVGALFGHEFRSLFRASPGAVLVGTDMSGIEARMLAHYLLPLDGGAFRDRVLEGDIHSANLEAIQRVHPEADRNDAKTTCYAVLYGARPRRIAHTLGISERKASAVRKSLMDAIPGLERLIASVEATAESRGWLKGLDGRRVRPRRGGASLNTLLQSGGAVVMKRATVLRDRALSTLPDWRPVLHVHDEYQSECSLAHADAVALAQVQAIEQAGRDMDVKCPLTGESKIGETWAETH